MVVYRAAGGNEGSVPAWFNEGLALTSSAEPDAALRITLENAFRNQQLLPLDALCVSSYTALQPADAALAYAQSESLMRYISDHFGSNAISNLMVVYADGSACSAGIERALGISQSSLESEWRAELQRTIAPSSGAAIARPSQPWLIAWGVSLLLALLLIAPLVRLRGFQRREQRPPASEEEAWDLPELP